MRMAATVIFVLFLVFFFLDYGSETILILLNVSFARKRSGIIPPAFQGLIDAATAAKAADYSATKAKFTLVTSGFGILVILAMVATGVFGTVDRFLSSFGLGLYLNGLLYIGAVGLFFSLIGLPFALYSQFVIEERFGFNKMTAGLFWKDRIKSLLLSLVIGVPLLLALFFFMEQTGAWWWLLAFGFFTLFQLVVSLLYPTLIAPLFNKFTPLPDGPLKEKIEALLASLHYRVRGIFVMDGSKRSRHANAYFTGLGKAKRIVLYDTLMKTLTDDELVAVFAHELGHEKLGHVWKNMVAAIVASGLVFFLLSLLLPFAPLYRAFGFDAPSYHALLVLLTLCSGPFTFFLKPIGAALSRRYEYAADRFARRALGGDAAPLAQALLKLSRDNLSNLHPHPLYSAVYYSHPTLPERIAALEKPLADKKR
jgi:STE24 endopeptidase